MLLHMRLNKVAEEDLLEVEDLNVRHPDLIDQGDIDRNEGVFIRTKLEK